MSLLLALTYDQNLALTYGQTLGRSLFDSLKVYLIPKRPVVDLNK